MRTTQSRVSRHENGKCENHCAGRVFISGHEITVPVDHQVSPNVSGISVPRESQAQSHSFPEGKQTPQTKYITDHDHCLVFYRKLCRQFQVILSQVMKMKLTTLIQGTRTSLWGTVYVKLAKENVQCH